MDPIQLKINQAFQLHQVGQIQNAVAIYEEILKQTPNHWQVLLLLGTGYYQLGRLDAAILKLNSSIELNPDYAEAYSNRGVVLNDLKRKEEALCSYDHALRINPLYAEAYSNRGVVLKDLNRLEEALSSYDQAIKINPLYAEAHSNRGVVLKDLNRLEEALSSYDQAIRINRDYAEAYSNRGNVLKELNRLEEALCSYDQAIRINPHYAEAYSNRANVLKDLLRLEEALCSYDQAIRINPHYAEAYTNRGVVLKDLNRLEQALNSYNQALRINPNYVEVYCNRGVVLSDLNRLEEALSSYDQALKINPNYAEVYSNRGNVLKDLNRLEEALCSYDQAIRINPNHADAYWNKSLALILMGDYLSGWALYEWRRKKQNLKKYYRKNLNPVCPNTSYPEQSRFFIYAEQGLGDTIQFCRYLKTLAQLGLQVVFEAQPSLQSLIASVDDRVTVISAGDSIPNFDYQSPLLSLPWLLKTTVEQIPAETAYLSISNSKQKEWTVRLGAKIKPRVGIVWSGSHFHENDRNRSIRLEQILPLLNSSIEWHSLQKQYQTYDLELLNQHPEIHQHQTELNDFTDTGALIQEMDLVISVDTSVAHLAGALGKSLWVLLPFMPDYRWLLNRDDSPWYPSARLYRQDERRQWESVIERVSLDLELALYSQPPN